MATKQIVDLLGLDLTELQAFVRDLSEPAYRGQQIFEWLYKHAVTGFAEMTNLSKQLRERLAAEATVGKLQPVQALASKRDKSVKYLFRLPDGLTIESVLMFEKQRATLCVSTQVGCAIDCKFCATGMMGLKRNLTAGEIIDQVLTVQRESGKTVTNVVCMGMGEPFHNYDNLMKACDILTHELGTNLSSRHIVISTSGIVPKILRFADEQRKYRLAVSLNATTDAVRDKIMPLNKKWPIAELRKAIAYYTRKSGEPVTVEYVLLAEVNDMPADAVRLKKILRGLHFKLNLIPYNTVFDGYRRPTEQRIQQFYRAMASLGVPVMIRWSKGDDIEAGCGQLASKRAVS